MELIVVCDDPRLAAELMSAAKRRIRRMTHPVSLIRVTREKAESWTYRDIRPPTVILGKMRRTILRYEGDACAAGILEALDRADSDPELLLAGPDEDPAGQSPEPAT